MSHSHTSILIHAVFATKDRCPMIPSDLLPRLWAFSGGIAKQNGMIALAVGGTTNHMHALLSLPATMPVAKALQVVKAGSSKFLNEQMSARFEWQEGYGAFSVGVSQKGATAEYIRGQAEHHRKVDFAEEYRAFLAKHGIVLEFKRP
jgi:REP element-mobilizing transposase RayT